MVEQRLNVRTAHPFQGIIKGLRCPGSATTGRFRLSSVTRTSAQQLQSLCAGSESIVGYLYTAENKSINGPTDVTVSTAGQINKTKASHKTKKGVLPWDTHSHVKDIPMT